MNLVSSITSNNDWSIIPTSEKKAILDWKKDQEFQNDCNRVRYGIVSNSGSTRYNTKREAELALERMLEERRKNKKKSEGLGVDWLRKEIDRLVDANCKQCGQPTVAKSNFVAEYLAECNECNIKRRKHKHEEFWGKQREEDQKYPIIKYCHDIRNKAHYWEIPFERLERFEKEHGAEKYVKSLDDSESSVVEEEKSHFSEYIYEKNKDVFAEHFAEINGEDLRTGKITKEEFNKQLEKEWNEVRHKKRFNIESRKQRDLDWDFAFNNSPFHKYRSDVLNNIGCECHNENMRLTGNVCKTCKLMLKVREYTINLFKDAAEGRKSFIFRS